MCYLIQNIFIFLLFQYNIYAINNNKNILYKNDIILNGKYEIIDDIQYIYQFPTDNNNHIILPTAVLFIAHGCSHSATDWFPTTSNCIQCTGRFIN